MREHNIKQHLFNELNPHLRINKFETTNRGQGQQTSKNNIKTTNTNEDGALPEIEREAYEKGNMMLRNWEDSIKNV